MRMKPVDMPSPEDLAHMRELSLQAQIERLRRYATRIRQLELGYDELRTVNNRLMRELAEAREDAANLAMMIQRLVRRLPTDDIVSGQAMILLTKLHRKPNPLRYGPCVDKYGQRETVATHLWNVEDDMCLRCGIQRAAEAVKGAPT